MIALPALDNKVQNKEHVITWTDSKEPSIPIVSVALRLVTKIIFNLSSLIITTGPPICIFTFTALYFNGFINLAVRSSVIYDQLGPELVLLTLLRAHTKTGSKLMTYHPGVGNFYCITHTTFQNWLCVPLAIRECPQLRRR